MRIEKVEISNFRTIHKATIEFYDVTSFVGPNGVGKSTILYALDWFFNGSKAGDLTAQDATYGYENENIEVAVTFNNLNTEDRDTLGKYVNDDSKIFKAWKVRDHLTGSERLSANVKGFEPFSALKNSELKATELKSIYKEIQNAHTELDLKNANTKNAILDEISRWESEHPEQLTDMSEELSTSFKGFNSNAAMATRFRFTLVKADLRANEEAEDGRNTLLSEIVERTMDRKSADEKLADAFSNIETQERDIYEDVFGDSLNTLTKRLNKVVNGYNNNRSVEIQPNIQDIMPPKTTFKIRVNDGEYQTDVSRQGHGFQRTLLISALQLLSEQEGENNNGTLCLAIEEPELFQHPIQAQTFASVLRKLANNSNQEIQVTYATHSPYFLEAKHFNQIYRLVRHNNGDSYETKIYHASMDEVVKDLKGYSKKEKSNDNKTITFLSNLYSNELSIGIFSNEVILVEGNTDKVILEGISSKLNNVSLARKGIAVISCGSKQKIPQCYAILNRLGIPTKIMFDNDSGWNGRPDKRGNNPSPEKGTTIIKANEKLMKFLKLDNDISENGFPNPGVHGNVFVVDDTLEPFLETKWDGWLDKREEVSKKNMIDGKSAESYSETIQLLSIDKCPDDVVQFLKEAIEEC